MKSIDKVIYEILGKKIKKARENKNYSLQDLADKINVLIEIENKELKTNRKPIIRQSLGKMELGKLRIENNLYYNICQALDLDPTAIYNIGGKEILQNKESKKIDDFLGGNNIEAEIGQVGELKKEDAEGVIDFIKKDDKKY